MRFNLRNIFLITLFCSAFSLFSQDIHFTQYYFSPLSLNPANTGNYAGDYRGMANYRSQWKEIDKAYKTISVGGDMNFYPMNQKVSGGLYILNDKSGGNLVQNKILISGAAHKKIAGFELNLGIQPGVVMKSIDFNAHSFPNQLNWGTGQFDNTLPNNETNIQPKTTYFDMNAGFVVSRKFTDKFEAELGFAFFHLNKPKETFLANDNKLPVRQIYHAEIRYFVSPKLAIKPHTMINATSKASDWVTGVTAEYTLSKTPFFTNTVFAGFMWRDGFKRIMDAGMFTAGMKYQNYTFGVSYDVNTSQLHTATNYKGALELALIYTAKNTRLIKKEISCDRY
ncbi:MAG: PorP/SprF family type IX secretion system membrane protein [Bacteroidota bacterium]|nr:PorP/SprF family type IX secretion system membrane protein [Bacteroidota bacterium]